MSKYLLYLSIIILFCNCSNIGSKTYNCNCDNLFVDAYYVYNDNECVKYINTTSDTIRLNAKVYVMKKYKNSVCWVCKSIPCSDPCESTISLYNDSIELFCSYKSTIDNVDADFTCAYSNNNVNKFDVFTYKITDKNNINSSICLQNTTIHNNEYWDGLYELTKTKSLFFSDKGDLIRRIGTNSSERDVDLSIYSVVQSMTITEGVGISRIEFECGEVWTIVQ